jgi:uncharacterized membrane protein YfcA
MEYILIAFSTLLVSVLTFYSGFGLGTLLMPVVAIFFPLPVAIGLTALVHLLHNLMKAGIFFKYIQWKVTVRFGAAALLFAIPGSLLLQQLSGLPSLGNWTLSSHTFEISILHLSVGFLLIFFATLEMFPRRLKVTNLFIGGALSGFFGGLSGHQGAFRSAFLWEQDLKKESFIGTSALIAIIVDSTRLVVYGISFSSFIKTIDLPLLFVAFGSAFLGICVGMLLLKKMTLDLMQRIIIFLLYFLGLLLILGII